MNQTKTWFPKAEKLSKKNYKTLGASRLVQIVLEGFQMSCRNKHRTLNRNSKTLKTKRSFTRIIRNEGVSLTQSTTKSEPTWFMRLKVSKASRKNGNWKKFRRTCLLSPWLLLQLLSQRKRMWRSDMRLQRCRWRSRPRLHLESSSSKSSPDLRKYLPSSSLSLSLFRNKLQHHLFRDLFIRGVSSTIGYAFSGLISPVVTKLSCFIS